MKQNNYEDIIDISYPTSKKHKRMPIEKRAAQFAPFAALTGYEDAINETGRITESKVELSEEEKLNINDKLQTIKENIKSNKEVTITYFESDKYKEGGKYLTYKGQVKKIDELTKTITLSDKSKININDIIDIV